MALTILLLRIPSGMFTQSCEKGPGNGTILTNGKGISQIPFHTDRHSKEKRNRRLKQACTGKDGELALVLPPTLHPYLYTPALVFDISQ